MFIRARLHINLLHKIIELSGFLIIIWLQLSLPRFLFYNKISLKSVKNKLIVNISDTDKLSGIDLNIRQAF